MAPNEIYISQKVKAKITGGTFRAGDVFMVESLLSDHDQVQFVACRPEADTSRTLYFRPEEIDHLQGDYSGFFLAEGSASCC